MFEGMIGPSHSSLASDLAMGSAMAIVFGFVTGAFNEEIRFRGYYQGVAANELTPLAGFVIGFIPFSFGHYFAHPDWSLVQVVATVLPGVVFGLLYNATGSLVAVMTAHTLVNWIGSYPALLLTATKSRTVGVAATVVLWIIAAGILFWRRKRELREWRSATRGMFRERPGFGLITGIALGLALLAVWPLHLPTRYAALVGVVLLAAVFLWKHRTAHSAGGDETSAGQVAPASRG